MCGCFVNVLLECVYGGGKCGCICIGGVGSWCGLGGVSEGGVK